MDLIIPIETASRELSYKIFLCNKLSSLGFNCYMGNKYYVNHLIGKMKNYVYIDKGFHKGKSEYLYNTIKANNGIIVSLDEEGAIDYSDNSTLLNVRYPEEMLDKVDIVFLWGNNQYELLKEKIKHKNKLHVTGHPRFQLLKSKYHSLYNDEVQEIRTKTRNIRSETSKKY